MAINTRSYLPPYPLHVPLLGLMPTRHIDLPLCITFLLLYICCAAGHMTIFQLNRRRGHKFILSAMIFGYCMCRITSMILRLTWVFYPSNVRLEIAASVFIAAGVLVLYIVNLLFAQRILRATHPKLGWSKAFSLAFVVLYALIPLTLAAVVTATIKSYYTLDPLIHKICLDVQRGAECYLLFFSFLPIPLMVLNFLLPRPRNAKQRQREQPEHFGVGPYWQKVAVLLISSLLLTSGTAFRTTIAFLPPRPLTDPAWWSGKACFWVFDIGVEIIVAYLYIVVRVDQRFHVADGASGPGGMSVKSVVYLTEEPDFRILEEVRRSREEGARERERSRSRNRSRSRSRSMRRYGSKSTRGSGGMYQPWSSRSSLSTVARDAYEMEPHLLRMEALVGIAGDGGRSGVGVAVAKDTIGRRLSDHTVMDLPEEPTFVQKI